VFGSVELDYKAVLNAVAAVIFVFLFAVTGRGQDRQHVTA
jgi:hypothetical protein